MLRPLLVLAFALLMTVEPAFSGTTNILAFGDSLTAGLGLAPDEAFPVRLEAALKARGHDVRVLNAGVSGDTTAAGHERLQWALTEDVDAVIVELGANDALRGMSPAGTSAALASILAELKTRKLPVLLAGMKAPRNLGPDYAEQFDPIFPKLAETHGVLFYPFFLDGVAADPSLNQPDGIHPSAKGVDVIVERILPLVEQLVVLAAKK
jgi:acyl-CoA thioesterase-1